MSKIVYEAIDRWNGPSLAHESHKYIAKEKINGRYRYFYSNDEYEAYLRGSKKLTGRDITGELRGDQASKNHQHVSLGERTIIVDSPNQLYSRPQSSTGLKKPQGYREMMTGSYGRSDTFVTPSVDKSDTDPRWAINQSYKPKATKNEKAQQAIKNAHAKAKNKRKKVVKSAQNWLENFFKKHR